MTAVHLRHVLVECTIIIVVVVDCTLNLHSSGPQECGLVKTSPLLEE